jgi:hypothetical protein
MFRQMFFLVAVAAAHAQSPFEQETARARLLLQSSDWAQKAWGAYFAGHLHGNSLRPLVAEQIHAAASLTAPADYISVLLDAAVELNLELPAAEIEPFQARWTAASMILLARSPDSEESLLRLGDAKWFSLPWLAANNLLFQKKSPRWYRRVLEELNVTHRFVVVDEGSGVGVGGSSMCTACGAGVPAPKSQGFPPIAIYSLGLKPATGSSVVAAGPHTVYYVLKHLTGDTTDTLSSCAETLDVADIREGYLAAFADVPEKEIRAGLHRQTSITFHNAGQFLRVAVESLQEQEQQIRHWFEEIDRKGPRTPKGARLRVTMEITDWRRDRAEPLPAIGGREIVMGQ